jgi:hypothetical protein
VNSFNLSYLINKYGGVPWRKSPPKCRLLVSHIAENEECRERSSRKGLWSKTKISPTQFKTGNFGSVGIFMLISEWEIVVETFVKIVEF